MNCSFNISHLHVLIILRTAPILMYSHVIEFTPALVFFFWYIFINVMEYVSSSHCMKRTVYDIPDHISLTELYSVWSPLIMLLTIRGSDVYTFHYF